MMSFIRPSYRSTAHAESTAWPEYRSCSFGANRRLAQHCSQTAPESGWSSRCLHAAHGGSNSVERRKSTADDKPSTFAPSATADKKGLSLHARLPLSGDVGEFVARGAAPESIEAVKVARVLREDVD